MSIISWAPQDAWGGSVDAFGSNGASMNGRYYS